MISVHDFGPAGAPGDLSWFRREFHQCLPRRTDALFELVDAVLCADGLVRSIAECPWLVSIAEGTAAGMPPWHAVGSTSSGCGSR